MSAGLAVALWMAVTVVVLRRDPLLQAGWCPTAVSLALMPTPPRPTSRRHYLHTLEASQVNSLKVDGAAGTAAVSATFREAVEAHRGAQEPVQAFRWAPASATAVCAAVCAGLGG